MSAVAWEVSDKQYLQLARRKVIYLELHPETGKGAKNQYTSSDLLNGTMSFSKINLEEENPSDYSERFVANILGGGRVTPRNYPGHDIVLENGDLVEVKHAKVAIGEKLAEGVEKK